MACAPLMEVKRLHAVEPVFWLGGGWCRLKRAYSLLFTVKTKQLTHTATQARTYAVTITHTRTFNRYRLEDREGRRGGCLCDSDAGVDAERGNGEDDSGAVRLSLGIANRQDR